MTRKIPANAARAEPKRSRTPSTPGSQRDPCADDRSVGHCRASHEGGAMEAATGRQGKLEQRARRAARTRAVRAPGRVRAEGAGHRRVAARAGRPRSRGLVGRAGRRARLVDRADPGARRLEPAVLQVVRRRQAERLGQLRRSSRRGGQRRSGRVPVARRGGRGARRHLRRPARDTSSGSPTCSQGAGSRPATWSGSSCR